MSKIIEFKNTNYAYDSIHGFNDFNFSINEGDIVSLVGPAASGKTTILKMLCHKLPNETCNYNGRPFSTYNSDVLKKDIVIIFDEALCTNSIYAEITKNIKKIENDENIINKKYEKIKTFFELDKIESVNIKNLTTSDKNLIKILSYLIIEPKFIGIDSIFSILREEQKSKIIKYIKENNITLLNVVNNLDDTLYGNKIAVLDNFTIILEGSTASVLKTDTLLKRLGFKLPLAVDLSIELIHYDVLKKIYTDKNKLAGALWK